MRVNQTRCHNSSLCVNNSDAVGMRQRIMLEHWFSIIVESNPDNAPIMDGKRRVVYYLQSAAGTSNRLLGNGYQLTNIANNHIRLNSWLRSIRIGIGIR